MLTVLLMCSSGMSSTIIRKNMEVASKKMGIDLKVTAKAESAVSVEKDIKTADIILLAPQVKYLLKDISAKAGEKIPVVVMEMREYGLGDGAGILKKVIAKLDYHQ